MKRIKTTIIILTLIGAFLGYSYYNYSIRSKALDAVEKYRQKNNLVQIWHLKKMHLNVFDFFIEDKSQFNFIFINADNIEKTNNNNYWVQFSIWGDAQRIETLTNYFLDRKKDNFLITINDLFWVPTDIDTMSKMEIKGTIFEIVNKWVNSERIDSIPTGNNI
jgi:hypothetical protein